MARDCARHIPQACHDIMVSRIQSFRGQLERIISSFRNMQDLPSEEFYWRCRIADILKIPRKNNCKVKVSDVWRSSTACLKEIGEVWASSLEMKQEEPTYFPEKKPMDLTTSEYLEAPHCSKTQISASSEKSSKEYVPAPKMERKRKADEGGDETEIGNELDKQAGDETEIGNELDKQAGDETEDCSKSESSEPEQGSSSKSQMSESIAKDATYSPEERPGLKLVLRRSGACTKEYRATHSSLQRGTFICEKKRGNCRIPSNLTEKDFAEEECPPGSLVWAKLRSWPWWPAMVEDCPDKQLFYERDENGDEKYHVIFFGQKVTRSWLNASNIVAFEGPPPVKPKKSLKPSLKKSIEEAKEAAQLRLKMTYRCLLHAQCGRDRKNLQMTYHCLLHAQCGRDRQNLQAVFI